MRHLAIAALVAIAAPLFATACSETAGDDIGPEGLDEQASPQDEKADIYGNDDRHDLATVSSTTAQTVGSSTVALVSKYMAFPEGPNHVRLAGRTLESKLEARYRAPVCPEERFTSEPAPASCSGFLIAPDLVATAGHCVSISSGCDTLGLAFGFNNIDGDATIIDKRDFRTCKAVVGHLFNREIVRDRPLTDLRLYTDWAVIQLDEPVTHRTPLNLRGTKISMGEQLIAVGHPGGVPAKVTYGEVVQEPRELWFNTDLDIYGGNSGSVIVDRNGSAVGIVSRGTGGASYTIDQNRGCVMSKRCDEVDTSSPQCAGNQGVHVDKLNRFQRAEPVVLDWDGGWDSPIPNNGAPIQIPFDVEGEGFIHYITLNARISHREPKTLEYAIVAPDGTRRIVMDRPVAWSDMISRPSRTTFEFEGHAPEGRWFLEIRDTSPGGAASQRVEEAQLVFGIGAHEPSAAPTWVGSACESDADCTFENRGTPGHCFDTGAGGFCTLPCEGFCPDREGFATTFCIDSDFGSGICAATPAPLNTFCDAIPGTTAQVEARFVGSSNASEGSREVCAP